MKHVETVAYSATERCGMKLKLEVVGGYIIDIDLIQCPREAPFGRKVNGGEEGKSTINSGHFALPLMLSIHLI